MSNWLHNRKPCRNAGDHEAARFQPSKRERLGLRYRSPTKSAGTRTTNSTESRPRFTSIIAIASTSFPRQHLFGDVGLGLYIILCALCTLPTLTMPFKPTIEVKKPGQYAGLTLFLDERSDDLRAQTMLSLHWSRQAWLNHFGQCPQPARLLQCHGYKLQDIQSWT